MTEAQQRRRWLALAAFGTFGLISAGVILYRRRKRAVPPDQRESN
jgi:LPXTG-motif cell wall-anchored protein